MKLLVIVLAAMLCFPAVAEETAEKNPSSAAAGNEGGDVNKIRIIDGKKFFPLTNIRRFEGSAKPMPPIAPLRRPGHFTTASDTLHKNPLPAAKPSEDNTAKTPPATPAPSSASELLSIFAPEEKPSANAPTK
jgi:hypothetical protein